MEVRGRRLPLRLGRSNEFVVFVKLASPGKEALEGNPERLAEVHRQVARLGGEVEWQYRVLGQYDFIALVRAQDNETAARIATEVSALGSIKLEVSPAIALNRFVELLRLRSYRTEPHRWQTDVWARVVRRAGWVWLDRRISSYCRPLTTEGVEHVDELHGPALIIANHSSHFDTPVALGSLPGRVRFRTAVAAAADRFYRSNRRTWWYSLVWNTFPIARGGGSAALEYPLSLLKRGWSILIYPEG
ncbi:MAG: GYD domain-containing protein, partial [Dehalococcoidia bacterium]|nr:GYD domain-containing protein [Dehalococcoidia bacterium]